MALACRLNAMFRAYQKAMKDRVTTAGAALAPTTLATVLQEGQQQTHRADWQDSHAGVPTCLPQAAECNAAFSHTTSKKADTQLSKLLASVRAGQGNQGTSLPAAAPDRQQPRSSCWCCLLIGGDPLTIYVNYSRYIPLQGIQLRLLCCGSDNRLLLRAGLHGVTLLLSQSSAHQRRGAQAGRHLRQRKARQLAVEEPHCSVRGLPPLRGSIPARWASDR